MANFNGRNMISEPHISCIIPFWNEGRNIIEVLEEISKVSSFSEIICVDDASQDCNYVEIPAKYPGVKVIRLEKNLGKSGAVKEGIRHATGEYIFLVDADLQNLNHIEIEQAAEAFMSTDDLDMLILRRINAIFFARLYRADVLFTGERILRKRDLETILGESEVNGWQLESAINIWMYDNNRNVAWIAHSAINRHKYLKWGVLKGFWLDLKTYSDMVTAAGLNNMLKQIIYFAKNELKFEPREHSPSYSEKELEEVS